MEHNEQTLYISGSYSRLVDHYDQEINNIDHELYGDYIEWHFYHFIPEHVADQLRHWRTGCVECQSRTEKQHREQMDPRFYCVQCSDQMHQERVSSGYRQWWTQRQQHEWCRDWDRARHRDRQQQDQRRAQVQDNPEQYAPLLQLRERCVELRDMYLPLAHQYRIQRLKQQTQAMIRDREQARNRFK